VHERHARLVLERIENFQRHYAWHGESA
jgi:hypothetical protein